MQIGLAADSHDNLPMIRKAVELFQERNIKRIIHLGDYIAPFACKEWAKFEGELEGIFGNNDGEKTGINKILPLVVPGPWLFQILGKKLLAAHDEKDLNPFLAKQADVLAAAHTHEPEIRGGSPPLVNPGECGGWLTGRATVAILDVDTLEAEIIPLD